MIKLPESPDQVVIDAEIDRFIRFLTKKYPVYFTDRRLCIRVRPKIDWSNWNTLENRVKKSSSFFLQARKLNIGESTLYKYLNNTGAAGKYYKTLLSEATGTPEELWAKGGDLVKRKAAIDAWWARVNKKEKGEIMAQSEEKILAEQME
jgi:hypothetical protein